MSATPIETKLPTYVEYTSDRSKFSWRGKPLKDLSREDLEAALLDLNTRYTGAVEELGKAKRVQFVPLEVTEGQATSMFGVLMGSAAAIVVIVMLVILL